MRRVRYDLVLNICLTNFCMGVEYCYKCRFLDENEHQVCNITRWALDGAKEVFDEHIISKLLEICDSSSGCCKYDCILATGGKEEYCAASITALRYVLLKGMKLK